MLQRPCSIPSQNQKHRRARHGYQIEGQENDELGNLSEGEGRVDSRQCGFAKLFHRVFGIGVEDARRRDQVRIAFVDKHGVEDVNEGFVDEEGFEEKSDYGGSFSQDEESCIEPCQMAVEDC